MATQILDRTVFDIKNDFDLEAAGIKSLLQVLGDVILECEHKTTIAINDPAHPTQQIHALVKAVMRQFDLVDTLVQSIPTKA